MCEVAIIFGSISKSASVLVLGIHSMFHVERIRTDPTVRPSTSLLIWYSKDIWEIVREGFKTAY